MCLSSLHLTHGISHTNGLSNPRTSCFPPAPIFPPSSPHGSAWQGPSSQCPPCATPKHTEVLTELDRQQNFHSSVLHLYILTSGTPTILKFASRSVFIQTHTFWVENLGPSKCQIPTSFISVAYIHFDC